MNEEHVCKCPACGEGCFKDWVSRNEKCPWCDVPLKISNGKAFLVEPMEVKDVLGEA